MLRKEVLGRRCSEALDALDALDAGGNSGIVRSGGRMLSAGGTSDGGAGGGDVVERSSRGREREERSGSASGESTFSSTFSSGSDDMPSAYWIGRCGSDAIHRRIEPRCVGDGILDQSLHELRMASPPSAGLVRAYTRVP